MLSYLCLVLNEEYDFRNVYFKIWLSRNSDAGTTKRPNLANLSNQICWTAPSHVTRSFTCVPLTFTNLTRVFILSDYTLRARCLKPRTKKLHLLHETAAPSSAFPRLYYNHIGFYRMGFSIKCFFSSSFSK